MPDRPRSDLITRLEQLPAAAPVLARLIDAEGVFLVGGAVRDLLLGAAPTDLDLVITGELDPVAALLGAPVRVHERFGTCRVKVDGRSYDLARARRERYARPGALPTVIGPATIEEDLLRRDFTVNAIALGLGGADRGRLVAAERARDDLRARRLRVLHDSSFVDDPTRLLRLARYASRLRFECEPRTRVLAEAALAGGATATVSGARIGTELTLLAAEPGPVGALRSATELGVAGAIAPGFGIATDERARLAARALELLPADGDRGDLALAVAADGIEAEQLRALLDSLAFGAGSRDRIVAAAGRAPALALALTAAATPSQVAAAVAGAPIEAVALAGALGPAQAAREWLTRLRGATIEIDGHDLLTAGVPAGPALGAGLAAARAAMLDGLAAGHAEQLCVALRAARHTAAG